MYRCHLLTGNKRALYGEVPGHPLLDAVERIRGKPLLYALRERKGKLLSTEFCYAYFQLHLARHIFRYSFATRFSAPPDSSEGSPFLPQREICQSQNARGPVYWWLARVE